jgi:GT2 family glycosyltransferase
MKDRDADVESPLVSIVIVNWNGLDATPRCLDSILASSYPNYEILVADNASTDGSRELIGSKYRDVRVVANATNLGFGAAVMRAVPSAKGTYLVVLNNDIEVERDWLAELVACARAGGYAAVASLIVFQDRPGLVNGAGGDMNFLGLAWPRYYGQPVAAVPREPHEVAFCAGGVTLYDRRAFDEVGGFDDAFFLYVEDADLSWRLRLAGHRLAVAPRAILRHDWDFDRNPRKLYYVERNRLVMLYKNWSLAARLLLAPAFVVLEAAVLASAIFSGWGRNPILAAYWWFARPVLRLTRS